MRPEEKKIQEVTAEDLIQVSGGSMLDQVPVVDEHDYDEDIREKIGNP